MLRETDAALGREHEIAETAHRLAGSAGMLGFARLAATSRHFERAVQLGRAGAPGLSGGLRAAAEDSLEAIHTRKPSLVT